jgi:hypothetical protein
MEISNLVPGTVYDINIQSVYDIVTNTSTIISGTTFSYPPTITTITASDTFMYIDFNQPIGGSPYKYIVYANPQSRLNNQVNVTLDTASLTYINGIITSPINLTGLISGTVYDLSMAAIYDACANMTMTPVSKQTLSPAPIITGINIQPNDSSSNAVTVYYKINTTNPTIKPFSYTLDIIPTTTNNAQTTVSITDIKPVLNVVNSFRVNNLISGTTYNVIARAIYDPSNSLVNSFSQPATATTLCFPPTNLITADTLLTTSFVIAFTPPIGSPPISYILTATNTSDYVTLSTGNVQPEIYIDYTNNIIYSTSITITGLIPGQTYLVTLYADYDTLDPSISAYFYSHIL